MNKKGFRRWIRGPNNFTVTPSTVEYDGRISLNWLDPFRILLRDRSTENLWQAFNWSRTPQGHSYWIRRADGTEAMSQEDWEYCEALAEREGITW